MTPEARPVPAEDRGADDRSVAWLRGALLLVAIVVMVQAALGFAGHLGVAPAVLVALALIAAALAVGLLARRHRQGLPPGHAQPTQTWTAGDAAGAATLLTALGERTWTGLHRSTFLYDVLSYHLHLPAAWRSAGRLYLVPTPFGDPAPAYTPANAELVYHLGLAATGNATLAHAGQIPFAALAALAIYATARVLGATRAIGFAAALVLLLVPEVWQQAPTAMVDLAMASLFLAAVPFLLRLERRRSWGDVMGLGLALGLLLGTKYVAVVMSLPVLVWAAIVLGRRRDGVGRGPAAGAVVGLVLACGGFWYVRNALLTGNPLFPATLRIGSVTLARGLIDAALIRTSDYHLPVGDLKALLDIFVEAGWGVLGALGLGLVVTRRTRWPALVLATALLAWFVIPYQQSRFFFPVWGVAAIVLAATATRSPRLGAAALCAATLGSVIQFPTPGRLGVVGAAIAGAVLGPRFLALGARIGQRAPTSWLAARCTLAALALVSLLVWARTGGNAPAYGVGDHHDQGWTWIRAQAHGVRIAYAGSNLPLPLWGPRFENDVRYVNIAGSPDAAPHDFAYSQSPSGARTSTSTSAEPAPERQAPDQTAWLANLDALRRELLFVVALYPGVRRAMAHDQDGFPIERAWADARPDRFSPAFASDGVRIYRYRQGAEGRPPP